MFARPLTFLFTLFVFGALAGCSSDPVAGTDGGADAWVPFSDAGGEKCPAFTPRAGKGKATFGAVTLTDLPELACRTLRKKDGTVAGYAASFGRFSATSVSKQVAFQAERIERFVIVANGAYSGDGTFPGTLSYRIQKSDASSSTGTSGTLVLSNGGKTGKLTNVNGDTIDFDCDPSDDTAPTPGPALANAPGRAIIELPTGPAAAFDGIHCDEGSSGRLTLTYPYRFLGGPSDGPCVPTQLSISSPPPSQKLMGPGTYEVEIGSSITWDLIAFGFASTSNVGAVTMTLTATSPATGTFSATMPGGSTSGFGGSFTCPQ